jgi:hypothetical protein
MGELSIPKIQITSKRQTTICKQGFVIPDPVSSTGQALIGNPLMISIILCFFLLDSCLRRNDVFLVFHEKPTALSALSGWDMQVAFVGSEVGAAGNRK